MCRHLQGLFAKAKDLAQQHEMTVLTRPTSASRVYMIKYVMESLVLTNLEQLGPLLIPDSEVKSSAEKPHTQ
jgi:hypothetical protein